VSFRIQMKAPASENEIKDAYAYNSVFFSSYVAGQAETSRATVSSNSVRVGVSRPERLEIVKRTAGVVPTDLQNEKFAFRLSEKYTEGGEPQYLAFQAYDLYKADKNAGWVKQEGELHATDENGYLYLKADEKAVFKVADTDRILVEEKPSVFWESNPAPGETVKEEVYREETVDGQNRRVRDENGDIHVRTWTNTYRPVVYVQKDLAAVPGNVTLSEADKTFTFKLEVEKNGEYKPLANAEFWYVDSVLLDGGVPTRVNRDGEVWTEENGRLDTKRTASDGTFTIKEGQIIALFPGVAGTKYRLTEENLDEYGYGMNQNQNWYCTKSEVTGTIPAEGCSETITNYYRWKDLYLTKKITHQDPAECTQNFTFQIIELELDENGRLKLDAQGNPIEVKKLDASGNPMLDSNGNQITATAGKTWRLQSTEGANGTGTVASGTLDNEGKFTYALAGKTAIISGLEAGRYYMVKEMAIEADQTTGVVLYQPVKDSEEFKLPPYSVKKEVTITNDYLKRPLSVTKTVSGEKSPDVQDPEFEFTIQVNGQPLPTGIHYTVTKQGEIVAEGTTTGTDGKFRLRDGQTVTFKDAGMLGDSFEVRETPFGGYDQVYPANGGAATSTLSGEGGKASFVNGMPGTLRISKEYVNAGTDASARAIIERWINTGSNVEGSVDERAVELLLELTVGSNIITWPPRNMTMETIDQNGNQGSVLWEAGKPLKISPGVTVLISVGNIPISYNLKEVESSQKRIVKFDTQNGSVYYLQISQKYPADNGSITGTVLSNPNATIVNEVKTLTFTGSKVGKQMTSASSEVPTGEKLVWRLERYENGSWIPAEGISYAVFDDAGTPISNEVKTTEADGKITLMKTDSHYPEVWFTENTVHINLYNAITTEVLNTLNHVNEKPLLRLVEVPEESGKQWGMLVGYGTKENDSWSWDANLTDPGDQVRTFFNSNRKSSIEIEKYMETKSYQEFTMILEQVVAVDGSAKDITPANYEDKILKSEPRGGISYTIHNVDGTEVTGNKNGTTGPGGEIQLKAGQYVILDVPDGTLWTVSEDVYATQNYELKDLAPYIKDPGGKLTRLDDNLMLINLPAAMRYTLVYDGNGEGDGVSNVPAPMTVDVNSTAEAADFIISSGVPVREGYVFKGWAKVQNAASPEYGAGSPIQLTLDKLTMTLYAVWKKLPKYDYILYFNGNGKMIKKGDDGKPVQQLSSRSSNKNTPSYALTIPKEIISGENGWTLLGWSETKDATEPQYLPGARVTLHCTDVESESDTVTTTKNLYAVWRDDSITVTMSADKTTVTGGETLTFTITVMNNVSRPIDVTIKDILPYGMNYKESSPEDCYDEKTGTVMWNNITVSGGESREITLVVTVNDNVYGSLVNLAEVEWEAKEVKSNSVTISARPKQSSY
ncbi:MAG: DUF11 domain-containing protein, partial [Lachnospiraceae bacterium]|nr:DUF11 domain-containing protein [Lachnospiraceae bacterium]